LSQFRILIVDDYAPFRDAVHRIITESQGLPALHIVAEAGDGLVAVRKAEELQPDLILLDIGLPGLNGIEAARRIGKLSPKSKILFVSQESSADVVQGALATGACGYVVKADAVRELVAAVKAVLRDEQFVGSRFSGHGFGRASGEKVLKSFRTDKVLAPLQSQGGGVTGRHEVQFYSDDACFLDSFTRFIGDALKAGNVVIVVATESHRDGLLLRLQARGVGVVAAIEQGRYISLDAADTLSTFMVNGLPDPVRFLKAAGDLIAGAAKVVKGEQARVAACGECASLLWAQGNAEAAIQVEHLWNGIVTIFDVDILCGYPLDGSLGEQGSQIFQEICAEHSAVHS